MDLAINMEQKSEFYTLTGYKLKQSSVLTEAMEDYLEMIARDWQTGENLTIKRLAEQLNVKPSSVSKMCHKLCELGFLDFQKYGTIQLTEKGKENGSYLLWRHNLLTTFLKQLNQEDFSLEQVEKIEHFIDGITLEHLEQFLKLEKDLFFIKESDK